MNIEIAIARTGLEEKEARIYLAALELGMASAQEIAKKAAIQRTYFYDLSRNLIKNGLLRQMKKGKKRFFVATAPEKLIEIERERIKNLEGILPQLKAIQNTKSEKPKIFYYEGGAGIQHINNDTLKYTGEIVGFTTPRFVSSKERKISKEYIEKRIGLGNKVRIIGEMSSEIIELKRRDQQELRETRILPKDVFSSEVEIGMYGDKVFIVDYKNEFGFIIEGMEIAQTMKKVFEIVWNSGKIIE